MISIAMTTYNGEKFLHAQLDSILAQTISDWELIICDDCSKDSTVQILKEYSQKDTRIKVYINENNLGFKKNFEKAISLCKGDYIALSDQDDIWFDNHLEVLLKKIEGKSAVTGNAVMVDSKGTVKDYDLSHGDRFYAAGNDIDKLYTILCYRNPFFGAISMYKRDFLNVAIPIPDFVKYHDTWFSVVACCMDGLDYTYEHLLNHRVHGKNETGEHHISFFKQLASLKNVEKRREFSLISIKMCNEVLARIPNMKSDLKETIKSINQYHENKLKKNRFKTIIYTIKHYKQIYSTSNYKQLFSRCVGLLLQRI